MLEAFLVDYLEISSPFIAASVKLDSEFGVIYLAESYIQIGHRTAPQVGWLRFVPVFFLGSVQIILEVHFNCCGIIFTVVELEDMMFLRSGQSVEAAWEFWKR
jgi:hypothetical protein